MQRRHRARRNPLEQREMQQVDVEMQHVELVRALAHLVQHREVRGDVGFERRRIEADRLIAHRREPRGGPRIEQQVN